MRESILAMNTDLSKQLDTLRLLLQATMNDYDALPKDKKLTSDQVAQLDRPIRWTFSGQECLIFTTKLFHARLNQISPNTDPDAAISLATAQKLLLTSKSSPTRPTYNVTFGKRDDSSDKDYQEWCYVFLVDEVKKYLNI